MNRSLGSSELVAPFQSPRMLLRPLCDCDRDEFARVWQISAGLYRPWLPATVWDQPPDILFDKELERAALGVDNGDQCRLVGVLADGRIAGFFNLIEIVRGVFQNAFASWSVSADLVGQGFGAEGARALLDIAFQSPPLGLGLHRVQANVIPTNLASVQVARKAGFRFEGIAKHYLKIAGEWQDHAMYAKLVDEHFFVFGSSSSTDGADRTT